MSKQKDNFFTTFKDAVHHILKYEENNLGGDRNIQQDLADAMDMNKGNLSRELDKGEDITAKMHSRIERTLGYKIEKRPEGWVAHKIQPENNIRTNRLDQLLNELGDRINGNNSKELSVDSPLQALEVLEKLAREFRLLLEKKDQKK